jgi:hypothetical protein
VTLTSIDPGEAGYPSFESLSDWEQDDKGNFLGSACVSPLDADNAERIERAKKAFCGLGQCLLTSTMSF